MASTPKVQMDKVNTDNQTHLQIEETRALSENFLFPRVDLVQAATLSAAYLSAAPTAAANLPDLLVKVCSGDYTPFDANVAGMHRGSLLKELGVEGSFLVLSRWRVYIGTYQGKKPLDEDESKRIPLQGQETVCDVATANFTDKEGKVSGKLFIQVVQEDQAGK